MYVISKQKTSYTQEAFEKKLN